MTKVTAETLVHKEIRAIKAILEFKVIKDRVDSKATREIVEMLVRKEI